MDHGDHVAWGGTPHYGAHPGMMPLAGLGTLLWLGFVIAMVWIAVHYYRKAQDARMVALAEDPSAMELLRRRYVTGQIDLLTFEQMVYHVLASEAMEQNPYQLL